MSDELSAILHESDHVNQSIQRIYNGMYTSFGVVLPGVIGIFVFAAREQVGHIDYSEIALAFIAALSLGSLWVQNLWMELFAFVRYRYLVLLPRLYAASGQEGRRNFLQSATPRSWTSWTPILLLNILSLVLTLCVWFSLCYGYASWQRWISLAFIAASAIAAALVIRAARQIEKEIKKRCPVCPVCGQAQNSESPTQ